MSNDIYFQLLRDLNLLQLAPNVSRLEAIIVTGAIFDDEEIDRIIQTGPRVEGKPACAAWGPREAIRQMTGAERLALRERVMNAPEWRGLVKSA